MILFSLLACPGTPADKPGDDTADSTPTTDDTGTPAVKSTWATVVGAPADALGNAVAGAGDLDGDGDDDVLVAAYLGNRVCAVFGPVPAGRSILDDIEPACLAGEQDYDYAGYGMAAVGDVTGDGVGDVMVGSIGNTDNGTNSGKAYLIEGPLAPGSAFLDDAAVAAWRGETGSDYAGIGVEAGGDLTGDGVVDLLVGASGFDGDGGGGGRVYVLAGPVVAGTSPLADAFASVTGLGPVDTTTTPPPHGAFCTGDCVGDALAGQADFDGDGLDDLAVGASGDSSLGISTGKVVVFHGPVQAGAWLVTDADLTLYGPGQGSYAGSPVRAVPDLTGDGVDDLLASADGQGAGVVYLVSPMGTGSADLADADVQFEGEADNDLFGYSLAAPTDLDGDGELDLIIGSPGSDRVAFEAGAAWIFSGPFSPGAYTTAQGAVVPGELEADTFGSAVDIAGDLDGDGDADLLIGARNSDGNGTFSGKIYFIDP